MNGAFLKAFQYWLAGGPLLIPIALVCFGIWVYFLSLRYRLNNALASPPGLEDELEHRIANGENLETVSEWLSNFNDLLSRVSSYVLRRVTEGKGVRDSMEECRKAELPLFKREMLILSSLVTAAPLLGLLGTVFGMVATFQAVAQRGADTSSLVAGGISQALITTQFGLIVALPGVFGLSYLRRMYNQLEVRFAICESHLLLRLERQLWRRKP